MTKADIAALERVFAAEIEGRLPFQSKAKIFKHLSEVGYLEPLECKFGHDRYSVVVTGYQLSHAGRLAYCLSCEESS